MAAEAADPPPGFWQRLDARLAWLETALLALLLLGLIAVGCAQVLLRNFAASGLGWADPLLRVSVLWIGLLGALVASRQRRHITVDLFSRHLPPPARRVCRMITDAFTAAICGLIAWHAARLVYFEYTEPTLAFAGLPIWLAQSIIPLGFGLIALRFAVFVFRPTAGGARP